MNDIYINYIALLGFWSSSKKILIPGMNWVGIWSGFMNRHIIPRVNDQ